MADSCVKHSTIVKLQGRWWQICQTEISELLILEDVDVSLNKRRKLYLDQHSCERSWKRHEMAECDRMECVHMFRAD